MVGHKRFIVRREYFGAYVFDRELQLDYIFDKESLACFATAHNNLSKVEKQDFKNMVDAGFILNNEINFEYFENEIFGEVFSAPIVVHFPYTDKCNLNCKHCFSKKSQGVRNIDFEMKIKVLDELKKIGVCKLMVGGGEPFLGPDFIKFLFECEKRGFVTKVFTNGLCLNDDIINALSKIQLGGISISVDSADDEIYKNIRGVDGLHLVEKNIKKLVENCNFPISISATIGKYNLTKEKELLDFALRCGVNKLKIRPIRPTGNAVVNNEILPAASDFADFLRRIQLTYMHRRLNTSFVLDLNWGSGKIVATNRKLDMSRIANPYNQFGCIAGKDILFIDTDGSILPCGFLPNLENCNDNVTNSSIIDVWKSSRNFIALRELEFNEECVGCRYFGNCRGGCPARSIYYCSTINAIDTWCPKKYFPIKLKRKSNERYN